MMKTQHLLINAVYNGTRLIKVVKRNIDIIDLRCTEDEVDDGLDGREGEECDRGDQKDGVSRITRPAQEDQDADGEEHQVYAWGQ